MQAMTYSATRANLKAVTDRVVADKVAVTVTRQKAEGVVMVSESEWDSIQ